MRFSSISDEFFDLYVGEEDEVLYNKEGRRPYVIIVKLKYKGYKHDFALPFRSNLPSYTPNEQYFSLPPTKKTKKNHIHAIHYIKMIPIVKKYLRKYHTDKDDFSKLIEKLVTKNQDRIINEAQKYLDNYSSGIRLEYGSNIDKIFMTIYSPEVLEEVAPAEQDTLKDIEILKIHKDLH